MNSQYYLHNIPSDVFSHHILSRLDECSMQRVALTSTRWHNDNNLQKRLKLCALFNSPCQTLRIKFEGTLLGGSSQQIFFEDEGVDSCTKLQSFDLKILKSFTLSESLSNPPIVALGGLTIVPETKVIVLQKKENGDFENIQSYDIILASIFKRDEDSVVIATYSGFWTLDKKRTLTEFLYPVDYGENKFDLSINSFLLAGDKLFLNYSNDLDNNERYEGVIRILETHQGKLIHEIKTIGHLSCHSSIAANKNHIAYVDRSNSNVAEDCRTETITILQANNFEKLSEIVLKKSEIHLMKIHKQKLFCLVAHEQETFLKMFDLNSGKEEWRTSAASIPFELKKDYLIFSNPQLKPEVWNWKHQTRIFIFNDIPLEKPIVKPFCWEEKIFHLQTGNNPYLVIDSAHGLKFWDLQFSEKLKVDAVRANWQKEQQISLEILQNLVFESILV